MQTAEFFLKVLLPLMAAVSDFISKVGFPIAAAVMLGGVIIYVARWGTRTGDRLAARFETHVDKVDERLDEIKPQLERIETAQKNVCRAHELHARKPAPA